MPEPVIDPDRRAQYTTPKDHGLYGFFNEKRDAIVTPAQEGAHGRAWEISELQQKSWDDLYRLWWICHKEANIVSTRSRELGRLRAGYGFSEVQERIKTVCSLDLLLDLFPGTGFLLRVSVSMMNPQLSLADMNTGTA
jgi:large subunit ribosomal protein L47